MICDNETGQCIITPVNGTSDALSPRGNEESIAVHYVGDPMCSWCWGMSDALKALETWCQARGFQFVLTNGGLRAGGGDEWNAAFRNFLRNEWQHINTVTGQPFNYSLLELDDFNYDTEPACRAVVSASIIRPDAKMAFFRETQKKFYTESADPKETDFYRSVCDVTGIDYVEFSEVFEAKFSSLETYNEFNLVRQFGVNAFPTVLVQKSGAIRKVASGYLNEDDLIKKVSEAEAQMF